MDFKYHDMIIPVNEEKVKQYQYHKAIPFDQDEADIYILITYKDVFKNPLDHLSEIGEKNIADVIDRFISREIRIAQHD